ncbi:MAG: Maf family protein [Lentimonas sp.]
MATHPKQLILASASPRRSELLQRMGLAFEVHPSHAEEDDSGSNGPEQMVLKNAELKAAAMVEHYPNDLVLGSDTTVALDDTALSKPVDLDQAKAMLQRLSGRSHTVYTAVALQWQAAGFVEAFVERSAVRFKSLDDATIDAYFELVNPLDKAGAYGIQEGRDLIIESVEGSVENVMGLPIQALAETFAEHHFDFRDES